VWRHGRSGVIRLSEAADGRRQGVLVEAEDRGPGLSDDAWRDDFSTDGGLGGGLGAVRRLTDRLTSTPVSGGTLIRAWKWKGSTSA
jgi:anti-sigma regulatory factor (Ser/Thr protein kinase)